MKKKLFFWGFAALLPLCASAQQTYRELAEEAFRCVEKDSLERAASLFREALKSEPGNAFNAELFAGLGEIARRQGRPAEAIEQYTLSLNLRPKSVATLLARAGSYMETGDERRAYTDYCDVLDLDKDNREALFFRAYINMEQRDYKAARVDYERLLLLDPTHFEARFGLAVLCQKEGRLKEAADLLTTLITSRPQDAMLYAARADVEKEQSAYDLALLDLEEAIRLQPDNAQHYLACASLYAKLGQKKEARASLERAFELGVPRVSLKDFMKGQE